MGEECPTRKVDTFGQICARNTSNLSVLTEQGKPYVCVLMRCQQYLHFRNTFERYVSSLLKFGFKFEGIFSAHF